MKLKDVLNNIENIKIIGNQEIDITNIHSDSRKIKSGGLFVAIKGFQLDGTTFIASAIENGALAVLVEEDTDLSTLNIPGNITILLGKNTRYLLGITSCNLYDNPSKKFTLVGVTGTKGKTTTTYMIKAILEHAGFKVGLMGSIAIYINGEKISETDRTTPEAPEIQKYFSEMAKAGVDVVILESSSQSFKLDRVVGCDFDIGVFTNLSEEHISKNEHANMEEYFNEKLKLFKMCKKAGFINLDDTIVSSVKNLIDHIDIKTFAIDKNADLNATNISVTNKYVDFDVTINSKKENVCVSIPGEFTVYNALGAISVADYLGVKAQDIRDALVDFRVLGRSELVPNKLGLTIMIDYAHTPSSLESILTAVKTFTKGRIICTWGVGGDRDKVKRPIMGEISGRLADYTILTSDQVRTEDPKKILEDIEVGIKKVNGNYTMILDRTEAIKYAISIANKDDIIVIPGLGHDLYLERNGVKYPYNEREVIYEIIEELLNNKKH